MFCDSELCRALYPQDCHKGAPSQFARPGKRRQCSNDVLKLGVSAALTAWSDAWGRGKGLFPCSVPSGTLPTTNKINKSASSTQEQSVCVGDPILRRVIRTRLFFSLSWFTFFPPQYCTAFFCASRYIYIAFFTILMILSFAFAFAVCKGH